MKFLKLPLEYIKKYWNQIDSKDRRLIRLYLLVSNFLLIACLLVLFLLTPDLSVDAQSQTNPSLDSLAATSDEPLMNSPTDSVPDSLTNAAHPQGLEILEAIDQKAHELVVDFHLRDKKYKEAIPHLERLYQNEPSPQLYYEIGVTYQKAGLADSAIKILEFLKRQNPEAVQSELPLAKALYDAHKTEEALKVLAKLASKNPTAENLSLWAGMQSEAYPRNHSADSLFKLAAEKDPQSPELREQKSLYEYRRGNFASALLEAEKFRVIDPLNFKAYAQKGAAFFHLNQIDSAEAQFRAALALAPEDYTSWYNLGEVYYRRSYLSEKAEEVSRHNVKSLEYYAQSLRYEPQHAKAHYRVGVLLLNNHQYKEAIKHFEVTLRKEPKNYLAHLQSAVAFEALNMKAEAKAHIFEAYVLEPLNRMVSNKYHQLYDHLDPT